MILSQKPYCPHYRYPLVFVYYSEGETFGHIFFFNFCSLIKIIFIIVCSRDDDKTREKGRVRGYVDAKNVTTRGPPKH